MTTQARKDAAAMRGAGRGAFGWAILVILAASVAGCSTTTPSAGTAVTAATATTVSTGTGPTTSPTDTPTAMTATAPNAADGRRGHPAAGATTPSLPADWPPDVPVPNGTLIGATGSNGQWTAQFLMLGSAADVRQSAADSYLAGGFTAVSDSVLNKGNRQITIVVENRDHNAGQTTLVIQVSTI